jgi:hypothetical protein
MNDLKFAFRQALEDNGSRDLLNEIALAKPAKLTRVTATLDRLSFP